jgi:hypothetical protein
MIGVEDGQRTCLSEDVSVAATVEREYRGEPDQGKTKVSTSGRRFEEESVMLVCDINCAIESPARRR